MFILLLVRRISALGNSFLRRVLGMVGLRPQNFCFPSMHKVQIRKIFSCKPWGCITLRNEGFLVCVFRDKIGLLLSSLSSCSTPADAREVASDTTFPHFFPLQGNVAYGAVDVSRHTKNTVTTGAIWLCS